jgi:DNA-binding CsgD family transcriptional regulator
VVWWRQFETGEKRKRLIRRTNLHRRVKLPESEPTGLSQYEANVYLLAKQGLPTQKIAQSLSRTAASVRSTMKTVRRKAKRTWTRKERIEAAKQSAPKNAIEERECLVLGTVVTVNADMLNMLQEDNALLKRQRDYLAKFADLPARVTHCDYDPAGSTTEYEPDKEAVELFGESALWFNVGAGPYRTCYRLLTKDLNP